MMLMRYKLVFSIVCGVMLHSVACAKTLTAVCEEPNGRQINYFSDKKLADIQEKRFIDDKTKIAGSRPTLTVDFDKQTAIFVIQDSNVSKETPDAGKMRSTNLTPLLIDADQMTFSGVVSGAPVMFTLYPKEQIGIYAQHSYWQHIADGVRASFFYMKCQIKVTE